MLKITARERDLGGFSVRRLLPYPTRRSVGPFLFFDHMGPADLPPGRSLNVPPHPHIHLATVTYLLEGSIRHRDSLGSDQLIEPGAINWMTAGRGIVHSERSPHNNGGRLNGIQLWVALPQHDEHTPPSFHHYPASAFEEWIFDGARIRLLLGTALGKSSPVQVFSDLFFLDCSLPEGAMLHFPRDGREAAAYLISGKLRNAEEPFTLSVYENDEEIRLEALSDTRVILLGGSAIGKRVMWWNFVSSTALNIHEAAADWKKGPGTNRFPKVPGDDQEYSPLPPNPLPTL